jgi:hypothetical protein
MAAAADSASFTDPRERKRSRISSGVGVAAKWLISASSSSDSDLPALAARTFSFLCTASGTFRIWIVLAMQAACLHAYCTSSCVSGLLYSENIGAYSTDSSWVNGFPPAKVVHVNQ